MGEAQVNLAAMDLHPKEVNDETLGYSNHNRREELHVRAKSNEYQSSRIDDDGDWWSFKQPTTSSSCMAPRCHLVVAAAKIKARIPASGSNLQKDIEEEVFPMAQEMGPWNITYMKATKASESNFKHMDVAAPAAAYPIPNFAKYIPGPVKNIDGYINQFLNHHKQKPDTARLKREHVTASVAVFQCNLHLFDTTHAQEHFINVHGLPNGIASLKKLHTITIDKDTAFVCKDLKGIEDVGESSRKILITGVYNQCIAKEVFTTFNGGRDSADLNEQRSQEFLSELKKKCQPNFFGRFEMMLTRKLMTTNQDIAGDFTTKWHVIEECLNGAISDLEGVARMDSYLKLRTKKYTGATLELLMHEIDRDVNNSQGTWDKSKDPKQHFFCMKIKYELVYDLVSSIGEKYSQLKECVRKELAAIFWDHDKIKEMTELQTLLLAKLEAKSIANHYNKDILHIGNVVRAQTAQIGEKPQWTEEQCQAFEKEWRANAVSQNKEKEDRVKVIDMVKKLDGDDKDLHGMPVKGNKKVYDIMRDLQYQCCFHCFSNGCLARYRAAAKLNLVYTGSRSCDRSRQWKFGELADLNVGAKFTKDKKNFKNFKKDKKTIPAKTATLVPAPSPPILEDLKCQAYDDDPILTPANIINIQRAKFTSENVPDMDVFGSVEAWTWTCEICGREDMEAFEAVDHWLEAHGIDALTLVEQDVSVQVNRWNQALEAYENGTPPLNHSNTPERVPAQGGNLETEMSSLETDLYDMSNTMKLLMSTTLPEISSAVAKISADQVKNGLRFEATDAAMRKSLDATASQVKELQKEVRESLDTIPSSFEELKKQCKESQDANSTRFKGIEKWQKQVTESLDANSSKIEKLQDTLIPESLNMLKMEIMDSLDAKLTQFKESLDASHPALDSATPAKDTAVGTFDSAISVKNTACETADSAIPVTPISPKKDYTKPNCGAIQANGGASEEKPVFSASPVKETDNKGDLLARIKPVSRGQLSKDSQPVNTNAKAVQSSVSPTPPELSPNLWTNKLKMPEVNISGIIWLMLILFFSMMASAQGTPITPSSPTTILASLRPSPFRTIYPVLELESRTWAYSVREIEEAAFGIVEDACFYLAVADDQCKSHRSSCRATMLSVENFEKAVEKSFDTLYLLQRICDMGNLPQSKQVIEQCRAGKSWRMKDFTEQKYEFLDEMLGDFTTRFQTSNSSTHREQRSLLDQDDVIAILSRHPRLAFLIPAIIGIAVGGGVIGTAAITSKIVAEGESSRIIQQIKAGRKVDISNAIRNNKLNYNYTRVLSAELDVVRLTEATSTHATVLVHDADDLKQDLVQLVSRKEKLEYTTAFAEILWSAIKEINKKNGVGLTSAEINRLTRLSADLSTLVTTLSPLSNSSAMCRNQILTKTLLVPIVDHHRRTEIEIKGGRMIPRSTPLLHRDPHYLLIPEQSIMSRETDIFGKGAHVVGRVCTASSSINASTVTSTEAISESFHLEFSGSLVLKESCEGRNGSSSTTHEVQSPALVTVPIFCSISSDRFSCGAVRIRSGDTEMVHTSHHRTVITQDHIIENKVKMTNTSFISDSSVFSTSSGPTSWFNSLSETAGSYKPLLIAAGVAVVLLAVATIPARRMWRGANGMSGLNIYNANNNFNDVDGGVANAIAEQHPPILPVPALPPPALPAAEQEEEDEPEEAEERRLEIWEILKKPVHLRTAAEMIAADDWARIRDPTIRVPGPDQDPFGLHA